MSWEQNEVQTTSSHTAAESGENDNYTIKKKLQYFLKTSSESVVNDFRSQLQQCIHAANPYVEIDVDAIINYDQGIGHLFFNEPNRCLNILEEVIYEYSNDFLNEPIPIQALLKTSSIPQSLRLLNSSHIGKLVVIPGLVISASSIYSRATEITAMCSSCKTSLKVNCKLNGYQLPRSCQRQNEKAGGPISAGGKCGLDPYVVIPELSKFSDSQSLKIQESPEDVPPGEMPRHISAVVDRALANSTIPGSRNLFVSIYTMESGKGNIQKPVLRVVGMLNPSNSQEEMIEHFSNNEFPTKEEIIKSIAPEIWGMEDVKMAIAAQLFGGVQKHLPDSSKLRGDINVLLFGDPSVAKSQILKFTQKVAPIGVYTSGKGSSAAGLTASVIKGAGGEFVLEGGAMVLADGGIVCIDEFDKMDSYDRVAIHEAMEQQTISIAKAGITAVLNTRTSVLAAANPVYGRFDDLKTARDNIDFQTTILSRFDLIFILKDLKNEERDRQIAEHVLKIHSKGIDQEVSKNFLTLKKFIQHAKKRCHPVIGESAMKLLNSEYVKMRDQVNNTDSIPITVRQLEALIRLSEAFAKMEMSDECKENHVQDAMRIFKCSTFDAARSGIIAPDGILNDEQKREIEKIVRYINRRCPVNSKVPERALIGELQHQSFSEFCVTRALQSMILSQQFEYQRNRSLLKRISIPDE